MLENIRLAREPYMMVMLCLACRSGHRLACPRCGYREAPSQLTEWSWVIAFLSHSTCMFSSFICLSIHYTCTMRVYMSYCIMGSGVLCTVTTSAIIFDCEVILNLS